MSADARTGDIFAGVCCCKPHPKCVNMVGIIVNGCDSASSKGLQEARVGDIGIGSCGHPTLIITGSSTVTINNQANARVGDLVAGCINGVIITGANNVSNDN